MLASGQSEAAWGGNAPAPPAVRVVSRSYDDYVASITHATLHGYILARETRPWSVDRHTLGTSTLEYGSEGAGFVASGVTRPGTVSFYLSGDVGQARFANGQEVGAGALICWTDGAEFSLNVPRPGEWWALSVPVAAWSGHVGTLRAAPDLPEGRGFARLDVSPARLARLESLFRGAVQAIGAAGPEGLRPAASAQLERTVLGEILGATTSRTRPAGSGRPRIPRQRVLTRIHELLAARPADPLYVADLCAATGLSERTLRNVVVEQYGMSPMRLLRSRRLCRLREALRSVPRPGERITAIAASLGFWHMGQLAADYRRLFGELPSDTTRRARSGN